MKSHESNPSPMLGKVEDFVVRRFKNGQSDADKYTAAPDLRAEFGLKVGSVGRLISELLKKRAIVYVGRARQAGRTDLYGECVMYGPEGSPMLPGVKFNAPASREAFKERKPKNRAGSGVIAGRWYVAPARRLQRRPEDAFPLAMLNR